MEAVIQHCKEIGVGCAPIYSFTEGGKGAEKLARLVVNTIEKNPSGNLLLMYKDEDDIED